MESCGNGTRDCRETVMSKVLTKTWTRFEVIWIILTVLVVSTNGSWCSWLWAEETSPTIHPCIKPISHVYSDNETLSAFVENLSDPPTSVKALSLSPRINGITSEALSLAKEDSTHLSLDANSIQ